MNTAEKTTTILQELSGCDEIAPESDLHDDLGLDSLEMVALLVELEEVFQIELRESDLDPLELRTVTDVIALIKRYCGGQNEEGN